MDDNKRSPDQPVVSIPFIAGQWSLLVWPPYAEGMAAASQSPSLRGSGRFRGLARTFRSPAFRLNPLHCGAVVASRLRLPLRRFERESQSPSLRGSGRFADDAARDQIQKKVSIPFIAGQWSLQERARDAERRAGRSQSPSLRGSGRFIGALTPAARRAAVSQSPSLRGSGRFAGMPFAR